MAEYIEREALLKEMRNSGRAAYFTVQDAPAVDPASCLTWHTGKPPEHDSMFAKFKGTEQWRFGMFETMSDEVLVTVEFPGGERYTTTSHTTDGDWLDRFESIGGHIIAWTEMPAPAKEVAQNENT